MNLLESIHSHFIKDCPSIHSTRLQSVIDVASSLQKCKSLSLTKMGRNIAGSVSLKHKIKKVDRLENNRHLHDELENLYLSLSKYVSKYISTEPTFPVIIDLCYIKDDQEIQMLSAEVAVKGRSIPLYRDVFKKGSLKGRASKFLEVLSKFLPQNQKVLIIMDAGFGKDWIEKIESKNWFWLLRIRQNKHVKLEKSNDWQSMRELSSLVGEKAKSYSDAVIMKSKEHKCRVVTKKNLLKNTKNKYKKQPTHYNAGRGNYRQAGKEPWILATNLPPKEYSSTKVINFYKKRMQIEESFRDFKSHRYGLGGRYGCTSCAKRWSVKLLLASIVQVVYWLIGIIGHSQGFQRKFQANTVRDKKVFSYFYLGQLIIEHDMLRELTLNFKNLPEEINVELARDW